MLIRTDSTFVRTTQLDNHLLFRSCPNASAATLARTSALFIHAVTASISRTHSQCQRRGRCPYRGEPRIRFSSSLENSVATTSLARQWWWSQSGSNRRPQACKASALPTELWPRCLPFASMVGRVGVEPTTSRLSGVRSNQLSYRPVPLPRRVPAAKKSHTSCVRLAG